MTEDTGEPEPAYGVVLDVLAHGRSDADEPQYRRSPVIYAVGVEHFSLYELILGDDADISIGDRIRIRPDFEDGIERGRQVEYDGLSDGARSELEYVIEEIVEAEEARFLDFFNESQPVSLRLHQLNLLPGIGDKLRDTILDQRKRRPFESFEDLESRVSGLHDPKSIVVDRIKAELRGDEDLKYDIFTAS
jgi:putative nucleotide binding protein